MKAAIFLIAMATLNPVFGAEEETEELSPHGLQFKECPAPQICSDINTAYKQYLNKRKGRKESLLKFVKGMKRASGLYDCRRSFDAEPVPALWICADKNFSQYSTQEDTEAWIGFLASARSKEAKELFASARFRRALDGAMAEKYLKKSLKAEKKLKGK